MAQSVIRRRTRGLVIVGVVLALVVAMFLDTKVQTSAEQTDAAAKAKTPAHFADNHYSADIVPAIEKKAVGLAKLSKALKADPDAAAKKYGESDDGAPPAYSVTFTGKAKKVSDAGLMSVAVPGVAKGVTVYVQMGPALNGTAVRDAPGTVHFPQFKNQIAYQNVGAELNKMVKKKVLAGVDAKKLAGKTVSVTGAFTYANPQAYMVIPVKIEAKK